MSYLPATVTLLVVLTLLNLVVTLGLVRRVGQLTVLVAARPVGSLDPEDGPIGLAPGAAVGEFSTPTVDGALLSDADLNGSTLVGFMTADCPACAEALPSFIRRAEAIPGRGGQVVAVVPGGSEGATELRDRLMPVARVVGDDGVDTLMDAFRVTSLPAYALLSGHTVVASHHILDRVPETAPT